MAGEEGEARELTDEGRRVLPAVQAVVFRYRALGDFAVGGSLGGPELTFACGQHAALTFVLRR